MSGRIETSDEHEDLQGSILSSEISILVTNRWSKVAVEDYMDNNEEVFMLFYFMTIYIFSIVSLAFVFAQRKSTNLEYTSSPIKGLLIIALLTIGGITGSNLAIANSNMMYFSMISAVQPATTVIVSRFFQKEDISNLQIIGAILLITAAALN